MKRTPLIVAVVAAFVALPTPALAHGLGGRSDLPVPLEYFLVGAFVVLLLSFGALAVLWPEPRLQDGPRYRGSGWRVPRWLSGIIALVGLLWLALVLAAGLFGDEGARSNIAPVSVWIVFWLVVPFASAVVGNVWSVANPWHTMSRVMQLDRTAANDPLGVIPATVVFVSFTWLELVSDQSAEPRVLGIAAALYTAYLLTWALAYGTRRMLTSADGFTVYFRLLSAIAPFGRGPDGRLHRRGWLRALPVIPEWRGLDLFVIAMIGTVTYDGLSATPWWDDLTFALVGLEQSARWFRTLSLLAVVAVVYLGYRVACAWAARMASEPDIDGRRVALAFAHTLVPIALAYAFAHYFTLVAFEGQLIVPAISDPLGLGWDLFGTVDFRPNFTWIGPTAVWWIQLVAIVGGHVSGVVLAHDRALAMFHGEKAVRSQYAMLALMVALTSLGLTILAAG
jgi:hypothetical protein